MKKLSGLFLSLLLGASAFAGDNRLIGTWKSDKEATLTYLKSHTRLTPPQLEKFGTALGVMTITYTATTITAKSGDWKSETQYRIVSETKDSVTIEAKDPQTGKLEQTKHEFDGNGFWVADDKIPGYKERFVRMPRK